jgi:uncharacterized protein with PIN domain
MIHTRFLFYGSLNDFLPAPQRHQVIDQALAEHAGVKHPVESLGVPHPEVEAIFVNKRPVNLEYQLQDGDFVEAYPQDVPELPAAYIQLRPPVPAPTRFVADTHLGRLAAYLRMLGFDTIYRNDYDDHQLAAIAAREGRVLLTRDRGLLKHKSVVYGFCPREVDPHWQLASILKRYRLGTQIEPWRRCIHCNGLLEDVEKTAILDRLEPKTKLYYDSFQMCDTCGRIYWQGSHFDRMAAFVAEVQQQLGE